MARQLNLISQALFVLHSLAALILFYKWKADLMDCRLWWSSFCRSADCDQASYRKSFHQPNLPLKDSQQILWRAWMLCSRTSQQSGVTQKDIQLLKHVIDKKLIFPHEYDVMTCLNSPIIQCDVLCSLSSVDLSLLPFYMIKPQWTLLWPAPNSSTDFLGESGWSYQHYVKTGRQTCSNMWLLQEHYVSWNNTSECI